MKKWHYDVVNMLRSQLNQKEPSPPLEISHPTDPRIKMPRGYKPDIVLKKDDRTIIIEVESYAPPAKIIEDLIFSFIAKPKADRLIIIFSNKKGKGPEREQSARILEKILRAHFPKLPQAQISWIEDENDKKLSELF